MEALKYVAIIALSVFTLIILIFAKKSKKTFKILIFNAFLGISLLAIINLTSKFTNVYIPINEYTVTGCGVFGVPAVSIFLIFRFIFI